MTSSKPAQYELHNTQARVAGRDLNESLIFAGTFAECSLYCRDVDLAGISILGPIMPIRLDNRVYTTDIGSHP